MPENINVQASPRPTAGDPYAQLIESARRAERAGESAEAIEDYERALHGLAEPASDPRAADVHRWIGSVHRERGETTKAESRYRESLSIAERIGYAGGVAHGVNCLAILAMRRGLLTTAEVSFRRAAHLAAAVPDEVLAGMVEQNLGILANIRGDLDTALVRYRAALDRFRAANDASRQAIVLNNLGMLRTDLREFDQADGLFEEAMAIAVMLGDSWLENAIEVNRAELEAARADWSAAAESARNARDLARRRDDRLREAEALKWLARVASQGGDAGAAERDLEQAGVLSSAGEDRLLQAEVSREYGDLLGRAGRVEEARIAYSRALTLFEGIGALLDTTEVRTRLGALGPG